MIILLGRTIFFPDFINIIAGDTDIKVLVWALCIVTQSTACTVGHPFTHSLKGNA